MGMDPITAGASAVGSVVGSGKAAGAQNNATNQAAQQAQMSQSDIQQAMSMVSNYIGTISPTLTSAIGNLFTGSNQQFDIASNAAVGDTQFGSSATNNAVKNFGTSPTNTALTDWNGLKPQELSALTDNAARAGQSDIATAQSRGAFGANQNAAIGSALTQNQLTSENAAINIGSNASQQELGAAQSANTAALTGVTQGASNTLAGLQAAGTTGTNLVNSQTGALGNLSLLNPNTSAASSGANTLAGLSSSSANTAASYGNPFNSAINGVANAAAVGSQGKGGSSSGGANNSFQIGTGGGNGGISAPATLPSSYGSDY